MEMHEKLPGKWKAARQAILASSLSGTEREHMNKKQSTDNQRQDAIKGIRISRMNIVTIVISCLLYLFLTATVLHVSNTLRSTYIAIDDYVSCIQHGSDLMDSSDYLTEQVRLYAATADPMYMERYFTELDESRRREKAVEEMGKYNLEPNAYDAIHAALKNSDLLAVQEIYAMRLLTKALGCEPARIPQKVRDTELAPGDLSLSPEEMRQKAIDLVFGDSYQEQKQLIINEMEKFQNSMGATISQRMEHDYGSLRRLIMVHQTLIVLHFAATLVGFIFSFLLVVVPMASYVKRLKANEKLQVFGAYECRCLAYACNTMFARNAAQENRLRYQAEHDALTGLLNRGAFDSLRQTLHSPHGSLGLLIIDVDKFKQVNDSFGHEMGDRVLKQVAALLEGNFRSADYPARIGGDEFAVILTDTGPGQEKAIGEKIKAINDILAHPADGMPAVSLSVGGAFSTGGFTDDLYKQADLALYAVKEHGRCGCRFYDETLENRLCFYTEETKGSIS